MLYVLSRGGTIFFPGASTIETLQTLELYKVQGLIASPGWLSVFLKHYDDSTDFRSGFEVILSTGSALSASLSQRVRARLCSNLIFYYGTTETSTISSALAYALYEGAAGYIAPGVTVRVIDSEGKILGPDNEGLLLVRTLVSVDRYLNEFAEAKTPFRDGYFDTGDIGCVTSEKMLVITGHKKGVLNLGGNKVSPRLIEEARCDHHSVREALAFAVPGELGIDEVWALVVPASSWTRMRSKGFAGKNFLMRKFPYDSSPSPTFPAPKLASWIGIG
ncbi:MAG: AMP-binding protein [Pseudolabrys sp.]